MLPTKNCKHAFEFVKAIIRNSFFTSDTVKKAFLMMSLLHQDYIVIL